MHKNKADKIAFSPIISNYDLLIMMRRITENETWGGRNITCVVERKILNNCARIFWR